MAGDTFSGFFDSSSLLPSLRSGPFGVAQNDNVETAFCSIDRLLRQAISPRRAAEYNSGFMHTQISMQSSSSLLASNSSVRHKVFIALIVLVWAVVYLGSMFSPPLMDDADTVHAEAAREMVQDHD